MSTVLDRPAADGPAYDAPEPESAQKGPTGRSWIGFTAILAATILNILDSTLVNVAGPSIRADLTMSTSMLEWIAASYTLALAVGLMAGARLGDMFGRKRLFLIGLVGFIAASVACSVAGTADMLIVGRVLQGLAAALVIPQGFGLIRDLFPAEQLGKAFGAMGPAIGLATVLGPILAGYLIDADLFGSGWRALFWINVPLGLFGLLIGARLLPAGAPTRRGIRFDGGGTLLLGVASFLLIFPLVDGRTLGWPIWIFAMMAASVPVFAAFVLQQRARLLAGRDPLIEFTVLRKRSYVAGVVFILVFFGCLVGFSLVVGLFLQLGLGMTPMGTSHYLAALAVGSFVGAGIGAWAVDNVGRPILHIGLVVMAIGAGLLLWSVQHSGGSIGAWQLVPGLGLFGLGMGQIFVPLFSIIMGEIDDREVGSAAGLLSSLEQLGASLGVAILGTVFFDMLRLEQDGPVAAIAAGRHLTAVEHTLTWVLAMIAVAWVIGWFLPRRAKAGVH